jgi:hypothetical protein
MEAVMGILFAAIKTMVVITVGIVWTCVIVRLMVKIGARQLSKKIAEQNHNADVITVS